MKDKRILYVTQGAVIAALYAVLTIAQNNLIPGSASAAVQFRAAEALAVLAIYTPAAIPGLTLGCVVANLSSVTAGLGAMDLIFGPAASLLAALTMYAMRYVRLFHVPLPALILPAFWNGVIVGFEIDFFVINDLSFNLTDFLIQGGLVAAGELAVLFVLGLPLTVFLDKKGRMLGLIGERPDEDEKDENNDND